VLVPIKSGASAAPAGTSAALTQANTVSISGRRDRDIALSPSIVQRRCGLDFLLDEPPDMHTIKKFLMSPLQNSAFVAVGTGSAS
jgi:hypothetical protein